MPRWGWFWKVFSAIKRGFYRGWRGVKDLQMMFRVFSQVRRNYQMRFLHVRYRRRKEIKREVLFPLESICISKTVTSVCFFKKKNCQIQKLISLDHIHDRVSQKLKRINALIISFSCLIMEVIPHFKLCTCPIQLMLISQ